MKKTLNIDEVCKIAQGLHMLLSNPGLSRQQAYWMKRNHDYLIPHVKKWLETMNLVFNKYAITIPFARFVPYDKYKEFKTDLYAIIASTVTEEQKETLTALFQKYEIENTQSAGQVRIPIEKNNAYQEELKQTVESTNVEIEYFEIEVDKQMNEAFRCVPAVLQEAMNFFLKEESTVKVFRPGDVNLQ